MNVYLNITKNDHNYLINWNAYQWEKQRKDQYITVDLLLKYFSVYHPVRVEENGAQHEPGPLLVLKVNRLADDPKAGRHDEHDDGEVGHVLQLKVKV